MGGFISPKSNALLFTLISAVLLSVFIADGRLKLLETCDEEKSVLKEVQSEEASLVHSRMLAVKTNDYGSYDPSPAFEKPPYKLIPN